MKYVTGVLRTTFPTALVLAAALVFSCGGDGGDVINWSGLNVEVDSTYFPAWDEFVAVEVPPTPVFLRAPEYPEPARRAGIECDVWIRVLIDRAGMVRDAIIEKVSIEGLGFEAAAMSAALGSVWQPAMQNGQPVACWVSYRIEFSLA
jgi:TonB family protein